MDPNFLQPDKKLCAESPSRSFCNIGELQIPGYVAPNLDPNALARDVFHSRLESLDNDLFVFCNESDVEGLEELTQYKGKFALVTSMWSNKFLVPSTEIVSLLQARLSEQVGKEIAFASSSLNQSLHVWVSYHSFTNDSIQPKM